MSCCKKRENRNYKKMSAIFLQLPFNFITLISQWLVADGRELKKLMRVAEASGRMYHFNWGWFISLDNLEGPVNRASNVFTTFGWVVWTLNKELEQHSRACFNWKCYNFNCCGEKIQNFDSGFELRGKWSGCVTLNSACFPSSYYCESLVLPSSHPL